MPTLHSQFAGEGKTPDGKIIQIPPPVCLMQRGPCVQVSITLADQIASELIKRQEPVPPPVSGLALIDTGAISSCIDEETAKQMQLPVVNVVSMASASHASTKANQYPIKLQIAGIPISFNSTATGAPLKTAHQGLIALIGRDLLQHCVLIYNGALGSVSLCV
jgi:predicted aspartyl protease